MGDGFERLRDHQTTDYEPEREMRLAEDKPRLVHHQRKPSGEADGDGTKREYCMLEHTRARNH